MLDQGGEGQMERERDVNNVCKYEKGAGSIGSSIVRGWAADRFPSDALRPGNILTWTFVSHWGRPDGRRPATGPTRHGPHTGNHWPTRNIGRIIFSCDIYCLPRGSFFKSHPPPDVVIYCLFSLGLFIFIQRMPTILRFD